MAATAMLQSQPSSNQNGIPRRRRRQSFAKKNIEDDVLMAAAIGDVSWLEQSLWDPRKKSVTSKEHGMSAIHMAAVKGQLECLKILVEKFKIDVNTPTATGFTPLHLAINKDTGKKSLKCVKYLLGKGAEPSIASITGFTPVHQAASVGHVKCLKELIDAGAVIDSADEDGFLPITMAQIWSHRECARILSNHQWFLDREREYNEGLKDFAQQQKKKREEREMELFIKAKGRQEGQLAFKDWLGKKGFQDIPSSYGPLSKEDKETLAKLRSKKTPSPEIVKTTSIVVKAKEEKSFEEGDALFGDRLAFKNYDADEDKKIDFIPLVRVSAKGQRRELHRKTQEKANATRSGLAHANTVKLKSF